MLPHMSSLPAHSRPVEPGMAVQRMVSPSIVAEGNLSDDGTYSLNGSANPKLMGLHANNVQADGSQEVRSFPPAPPLMSSASQLTYSNPTALTTNFPSKSYGNTSTWMPQPPNLLVLPVKPNAHATPASPGIPSSVSYPNSTIQVSPMDSTALLRSYAPTGPVFSAPSIQHTALGMYTSLSPQAPSPGQWLQPQQISGFPRTPFPAYNIGTPGPYHIPAYTRPPSAPLPDVQPPGVTLVGSAVGASSSSVVVSRSSTSCREEEQPPVTDDSKHLSNQILDGATPKKEKMDVWTAHMTGTGTVYYYNASSGQSTYEKPSGFKGETDKAITQSTPVSWDKLTGTDWMLVNMNDGKRYYYNTITKLSSWQMPMEVAELGKKQDPLASGAYAAPAAKTDVVIEKGSDPVSLTLNTPAASTGGRDATAMRSSSVSGSSSALDLIKRKLQDSGLPDSTSPSTSSSGAVASELNGRKTGDATVKSLQSENNTDKHKDGDGEADVSNSSSDSEEEDGGLMKEECILKFKEMLKERGVAPFSKWDKELPKIVFDPRFKAIADHGSRRTLFEHYVRTRAEDERKEKRAALRAAHDGFKQLLEEAKEDIDHNTDYQIFKKKWGEDPRFQALDRKEKELLLSERVLPLKKAVQQRAQAERAAAVSDFKSMLHEKLDMTSISRWSKVKDSLKSDSRYKSVRHEDREKLFNECMNEIKAAEEAARKSKSTEDNEDKLKERQRALQKRKEREEQEVERVRQKARRKEAVESYQALLVETIKDPQASWTESKPKLDKDPQGRGANPHLDRSDMEKLFREHAKTLHERCVVEFRSLLAEVITAEGAAQETEDCKTILSSWSTAKQLLKNDPRYNRIPRKERESLWYRHAEEIQRKQKKVDNDPDDKVEDRKTGNPVNAGKLESGSQRHHDRR